MTKQSDLIGKVVVITGGGGVLCSAMAKHLAGLGCKIVVLGRRIENIKVVADAINNAGGEGLAIKGDVLDKHSIENAHQEIIEKYGKCDILINGAGGNHPGGITEKPYFELGDLDESSNVKTFFDMDIEGIKHVFDLNFIGSLIPSQIFARDMLDRNGCSILNISSMSAINPLTKVPSYSASKAAISNFTQWLAVHFSKVGIRVNALAPGFFLTEQNRRLLTKENGDLTPRGKAIIEHTPMGRFGNPEELLGTVEWLCGEASAFVTGAVIPVDGGFLAYRGV